MKKVEENTSELFRKTGKIFDIGLNSASEGQVLRFVRDKIARHEKFYILTPNPELILMSLGNRQLKNCLKNADLAIADGIGLSQAVAFLSMPSPKSFLLRLPLTFFQGLWVGLSTFVNRSRLDKRLHVIKGRKFFLDLLALANKKGWKVFFLGGLGEEAQKAADSLRLNYKKVKIEVFSGPKLNNLANPISEVDRKLYYDAVKQINNCKPQLLFVAFGAPKQEIWIHKNLKKLDIGGAMVVGGTFRYLAGLSKLPPAWMERVGLEWVWRLITEPARVPRIFKAVIVFPWKVLNWKMNEKFN